MDWVEVFAPIVFEPYRPHAWPAGGSLLLDNLPFRVRDPGTGRTRIAFGIFAAMGYERWRTKLWRVEAFTSKSQADWEAFLDRLEGKPPRVVCDNDHGLTNAVHARFPDGELYLCECHLRHALEKPVGDEHDSELGQFIADDRAESPYERAVEILTNEALRDALENLSTANGACSSCATASAISARAPSTRSGARSTSPASASGRSKPSRSRSSRASPKPKSYATISRPLQAMSCARSGTEPSRPGYRGVYPSEGSRDPPPGRPSRPVGNNGTVNTLPPETLEAFQDHGHVVRTLDRDLDEARRVFEQIREAGVDYDDVTATLEREGVQKFADSFHELFDHVEAKRDEMASARS